MLNIFGSATLLRKATLLPLGYDGSIAYPWCPRSATKGHSRYPTGIVTLPEVFQLGNSTLPETSYVSLTGTRVPVCLKAKKISILNLS